MYCNIQYIEISKDGENTEIPLVLPLEPLQDVRSPSVHETKKLMVNPNCPIQILLDYVCSKIGIDKNASFDFCDLETGELIGIQLLKPWAYATNIIKPKQTYIIVFYEKDDSGCYNNLEPLVDKHSRQYTEILMRIKRQLSVTMKRRSTNIKKSRRGSKGSKGSTTDSFSSIKEADQKRRGSLTIRSKTTQ